LPGDGPEVPAGEGEARGGSGLAGSGIRVTLGCRESDLCGRPLILPPIGYHAGSLDETGDTA